MDLTACSCRVGEGLPGKVYATGEEVFCPDLQGNPNEDLTRDFPGLNLAAALCLPFSVQDTALGCIEFLKLNTPFTPEETEVCRILSLLGQLTMNDSGLPTATAPERTVLCSVREVRKSFRNGPEVQEVLKGINFDVYAGEMLCILGESGCGKSTMLNLMGGLLAADSGSILFEGQEISGYSEAQFTEYRRKNLGFIFQAYHLMPNLTALQNLELIAEITDAPMDAAEALALVGMSEHAAKRPAQLSGGQQQRVSIARALVKRPRLILADEPTAALDYATSLSVLAVLEKVRAAGTTVVMVTHNEEITRMADRVLRLRDGKTFEITVNRRPLHAADLKW